GAGKGRAQARARAGRVSAPGLFVVALEAPADLHGAAVLRELKALRPDLRAFGAGGPRMRAAGFEALVRAEDVSRMGVAEVVPAGGLALLPGSRAQEIRRIWPPMLEAARLLKARHPALRLVLPVAPTIDRKLLGDVPEVELVDAQAPEVLARANAAIVASGTATLEAALALTPLVVVYRTSWLTWAIGRLLVRLRFVSLVNLLAGRAVVPELLQADCTPARIAAAAEPLLSASPE